VLLERWNVVRELRINTRDEFASITNIFTVSREEACSKTLLRVFTDHSASNCRLSPCRSARKCSVHLVPYMMTGR